MFLPLTKLNKETALPTTAELREKRDVDDAVFLIDGSYSLKDAYRRHNLGFEYECHETRNSVERVSQETQQRTTSFLNHFSSAGTDTADDWLRPFAFAWNQFI